MPIVPKFHLAQDEKFVYVHINVPYVRVSSAEMICDGRDFSFFCKPYLLKLKFPHDLDGSDEEVCRATYDASVNNGTLIAHLPKVETGLHFPDLDLTTTLLQMRISSTSAVAKATAGVSSKMKTPPSIEVLSSSASATDVQGEGGEGDEGDKAEFDLNLEFSKDEDPLYMSDTVYYGFNRKYSHVFRRFQEEFIEMLELQGPDEVSERHRRPMRVKTENMLFDSSRYLGDLFGGVEDPIFIEGMGFEPFWAKQWNHWKAASAEAKVSAAAYAASNTDSSDTIRPPSSRELMDASFEHVDGAGGFSEEERNTMMNTLLHREYVP